MPATRVQILLDPFVFFLTFFLKFLRLLNIFAYSVQIKATLWLTFVFFSVCLKSEIHEIQSLSRNPYDTIRYDTIVEFNVDSKAEYSALSSTRSQKKKLKQTTQVPL